MSFYAYIYTDPTTYIPFYVGRGQRDRAYTHLCPRGSHNKAVNSHILKLKENHLLPIVTIIETSTQEFASMLELGLVRKFGRKSLKTGSLYNLTDGGEFNYGHIPSKEHTKKISESLLKFYKSHKCIKAPEGIAKMKATKAKNPTGTGRWMNKNEVQTKVKTENVQSFLDDGWKLGVIGTYINKEFKDMMRQSATKQWAKVKSTGHTSSLIKIKDIPCL